MSDFFSNLVARTIAQPTLRPRTRSRFEAPTIEEAPLVWPETTQTAHEPRTTPAEPAPPSVRPSPADGARPAGRRGVAAAAAEERNLSEPVRQHAETAPAQEEKRIVIERDVQRVIESSDRVVPVPVPAAARPHRHDEQPPRVPVMTNNRRGPREIEEVQRERVIRTTLDRTQRVSGRAQQLDAATAAEPVIQVSIGRIEVRAVTSASQRNAPRRDGAMTIDDYVAKRKAKERR